jgi:hypothetical protein
MENLISSLVSRYERGMLNRRELIQRLGLLIAAQPPGNADVINVGKYQPVSIHVSDVPRAVAFYSRTFGLTEQGSSPITTQLASGKCNVSLLRTTPVAERDVPRL